MDDAARDLADKTIALFGRDFERFGVLHEYYLPENGEPVLNMLAWREGRPAVAEF